MKFQKIDFDNVYLIEIEKLEDSRGFFARTFDSKIFEEKGLVSKFIQFSISHNIQKGTIRGMHYQINPYSETKLITCNSGKIFDVLIDLRPESRTFKKWFGIELNSKNHNMIYIPDGFAHGFQTLEDNSEVVYHISQIFMPKFARGIRWDDPEFKIKWPLKPTLISQKDRNWEFFNDKLNKD